MKEFRSFGAFAEHLITREAATAVALHEGLEHVARAIEKTAKEEIGTYQPDVGPFPAWAPLADATVEDRISQGYSPDEPLLRTGELRESISHEVSGLEAVIGSTSDIPRARGLPQQDEDPRDRWHCGCPRHSGRRADRRVAGLRLHGERMSHRMKASAARTPRPTKSMPSDAMSKIRLLCTGKCERAGASG